MKRTEFFKGRYAADAYAKFLKTEKHNCNVVCRFDKNAGWLVEWRETPHPFSAESWSTALTRKT